jgi:glucose-1-phosphate thymidylyltransferase
MRGIILAGGTGSRLGPLTKTINKHLLPVGALPMIFYPLMTLRNNGILDITIVSTSSGVGQLAALLGSGDEHGCTLTYRVQGRPGGIAEALQVGMHGMQSEPVAVILGDNVFKNAPNFQTWTRSEKGAMCFLVKKPRDELTAFGVPKFASSYRIEAVIEKPVNPPSDFAVTGLYIFGAGVDVALKTLRPGARGELEITDLLDMYAKAELLKYYIVSSFWGDAGTVEGMRECAANV